MRNVPKTEKINYEVNEEDKKFSDAFPNLCMHLFIAFSLGMFFGAILSIVSVRHLLH